MSLKLLDSFTKLGDFLDLNKYMTGVAVMWTSVIAFTAVLPDTYILQNCVDLGEALFIIGCIIGVIGVFGDVLHDVHHFATWSVLFQGKLRGHPAYKGVAVVFRGLANAVLWAAVLLLTSYSWFIPGSSSTLTCASVLSDSVYYGRVLKILLAIGFGMMIVRFLFFDLQRHDELAKVDITQGFTNFLTFPLDLSHKGSRSDHDMQPLSGTNLPPDHYAWMAPSKTPPAILELDLGCRHWISHVWFASFEHHNAQRILIETKKEAKDGYTAARTLDPFLNRTGQYDLYKDARFVRLTVVQYRDSNPAAVCLRMDGLPMEHREEEKPV